MEVAKIHVLAGMFDFDANYFSCLIEVKNDILGYFLRVGARSISELNIERVRVRKVI
jgi:hypothetical protein